MVYFVSKVLLALALPTTLLMLLFVWANWVRWASFGKRGNKRIALFLTLLLIAAFSPLANWLLVPLEGRFQRPLLGEADDLAGIILLGGAVDPRISQARDRAELGESADRLVEAAILARRFPRLPLIISGGNAAILEEGPAEAELMRQELEMLGVPAAQIKLEGRSRTTAENALLTQALLTPGQSTVPGRYVLVTSAFHMPRAVGAFRRFGFTVLPYPVDYRTADSGDRWRLFDHPAENLLNLDIAAKEWAGLLIYWLRGDTAALFPGPDR